PRRRVACAKGGGAGSRKPALVVSRARGVAQMAGRGERGSGPDRRGGLRRRALFEGATSALEEPLQPRAPGPEHGFLAPIEGLELALQGRPSPLVEALEDAIDPAGLALQVRPLKGHELAGEGREAPAAQRVVGLGEPGEVTERADEVTLVLVLGAEVLLL